MAYSTSNPPAVVAQQLGGAGTVWVYKHTDADENATSSGYFTDGVALGMAVGDIVLFIDSSTPKASLMFVSTLTSTGATITYGAVS